MFSLAIAQLRYRALATGLTVLLLTLATAMLVMLVTFSTQLTTRMERDARGVDLVVGAKGSPLQLILSSIYQIDTPTGNIPLEILEVLRADPSVARVIPLALGDNFRGFRIVGTEPSYLDLYDAQVARGRVWAAAGEAVIGAEVARETGAELGQQFVGSHGLGGGGAGHAEDPFVTVGVLKPTGTVVDRLILISIDSVWRVHGMEPTEAGGTGAPPPEITALLVQYRSAFAAVRLPMFINQQPRLQSAVPAIETSRLLSLLGWGFEAAKLFAWLLVLVGGLSIFVATLSQAAAREGDLALLRVMGVTRRAIFGIIVIEGMLTAAIGAALGLLVGHGAVALAVVAFARLREVGLNPMQVAPAEIALVLAVVALGGVAALFPALRVFRADLSQTLAQAR